MGIKKQQKNLRLYGGYTVFFFVAAILTFWQFFCYQKSMVWASDGLYQHYNAFMYFGSWCREVLKNIFLEHNFILPMWEWGLGYGSDVFTTLSYYSFGDPVSLISVFFPVEYSEVGYTLAVIARFYLAGIAFLIYARKMNCKAWSSVCASIVYVFCAFSVFFGVRHPFFISSMAYYPLVLFGCEKVLRKESPVALILAVFISALSNFYFFYKIAIFTVLYVFVRVLSDKELRKIKAFAGSVLQIGLCAGAGVMLSAVLFLPDVMSFVNNTRVTDNYSFDFLYTLKDYEKFIGSFVGINSGMSSAIIGVAPITYLAVGISFLQRDKDERWAKLFLGVQLILLVFPIFGHIINGFGYVCNRWVFVWVLTVSFLLAKKLPQILNLKKKERFLFTIGCGAYALLCAILKNARTKEVFAGLVLLVISLVFVWCAPHIKDFKIRKISIKASKIKQVAVWILIFASVFQMSFFRFSSFGSNYLEEFRNSQSANDLLFNESASAWDLIEDDDFYRIETSVRDNFQYNFAAVDKQSTTTVYWSLINPDITQYMELNSSYDFLSHRNRGLQSRCWLLPLVSAKYFVASTSDNKIKTGVPYNYELIGEKQGSSNKYYLYKTDNALPFGFTYDEYITREEYEKMSFTERQQATLQAAVIENDVSVNCEHKNELFFDDNRLEYELETDDNVEQAGDKFIVKNPDSIVTFYVSAPAENELYVFLKGVNFKSENTASDKNGESDGTHKYWRAATDTKFIARSGGAKAIVSCFTDESIYACGRTDYVLNLGCSDKIRKKITLKFKEAGIYTIEDLLIISQPVEKISGYVRELSNDSLENIVMTTNRISGKITVTENKLLCLSLPYTKGWSCYVDGEKTETFKTDIMLTGVELEPGEHKIELVYKTPYLLGGTIVSLCGVIATMGLYIAYCFNKKKKT